MKEIIAVIRPHKWQATKARLLERGIGAYTVQRVYGRGRQKGLLYLSKTGKVERGITYLPKRMVTLFVPDARAQEIVDLLVDVNRTGEIGDGKIFVCPVETAARIRTGEADEALAGDFHA
jgi:nitrogen regulatory protein PII 2